MKIPVNDGKNSRLSTISTKIDIPEYRSRRWEVAKKVEPADITLSKCLGLLWSAAVFLIQLLLCGILAVCAFVLVTFLCSFFVTFFSNIRQSVTDVNMERIFNAHNSYVAANHDYQVAVRNFDADKFKSLEEKDIELNNFIRNALQFTQFQLKSLEERFFKVQEERIFKTQEVEAGNLNEKIQDVINLDLVQNEVAIQNKIGESGVEETIHN